MQIHPKVTLKNTADCEPGELVRFQAFQREVVAVVATGDDSPFLVLFSGEPPGRSPCYYAINNNLPVLSYGQGFELNVDHTAPIEFKKRNLYEVPGCLVRTSSAWLLRVAPARGQGLYNGAYFNLETSDIVVSFDDNDAVTFTSWKIGLYNDSDCGRSPTTLFKFSLDIEDKEH